MCGYARNRADGTDYVAFFVLGEDDDGEGHETNQFGKR